RHHAAPPAVGPRRGDMSAVSRIPRRDSARHTGGAALGQILGAAVGPRRSRPGDCARRPLELVGYRLTRKNSTLKGFWLTSPMRTLRTTDPTRVEPPTAHRQSWASARHHPPGGP